MIEWFFSLNADQQKAIVIAFSFGAPILFSMYLWRHQYRDK